MLGQKIFDLPPTMNRMLVPDHDDGTRNTPQKVFQKENDFFPGDCLGMGLRMQFNFALFWTDADRSDEIQALLVIDAGAQNRRLATR